MIGVTPMIGVNDDTNEVFDKAAAQQLTTFAQQHGHGADLDVVAQPRHSRHGEKLRRRHVEQHYAERVRLLEDFRDDLTTICELNTHRCRGGTVRGSIPCRIPQGLPPRRLF